MVLDAPAVRLRLFVAIEVPAPIRAAMRGLQEALQGKLTRSRVTWTRPEQFHLTLRFLGHLPAERCEVLTGVLREVANSFSALWLRANGIGFFPSPRVPRVAWVGVEEQGNRINALHGAINTATQAFTSEPAERHYRGHVTLARVKEFQHGDADGLRAFSRENNERDLGAWTAPEMILMRSQLAPSGASYSIVERFPFALPSPG